MKLDSNVKIKKAFYPWLGASLLCMAAIFFFSAQSAEVSSGYSGALTRGIFLNVLGRLGVEATVPLLEKLEVFVRKSAHVLIFLALGFCSANAAGQAMVDKWKIFLIPMCWCAFYAATDEFHQLFVPGRACMWQDWLIDIVGALIGVSAAMGLMGARRALKEKRHAKKCPP